MKIVRQQFRNGARAQPLRHTARDALQHFAGERADETWIDDVLIVISELVQNVSQHTDSDGDLVVTVEPGMVTVEVGDTDRAAPQSRQPETLSTGGRGLLLVEAISHRWGYRTSPRGKVVWAQIPIPDPEDPTQGATSDTPRPT